MVAGPASFLYAGILGLILVVLSIRKRRADFADYVPFAVLLLVFAEITGLPTPAVHAAGLLLVGSQVLSAWIGSPDSGRNLRRFYGTAGTRLTIVALSLWLIYATTAASRSPAPG